MPGTGDWEIKRMYVCFHCRTRKTATYKEDQNIYSATEFARVKATKNNGLQLTMHIRRGYSVLDYFLTTNRQPTSVSTTEFTKKSRRE
jgi:hypothetical protein